MKDKLLGLLLGLSLVASVAIAQDWYTASGKPIARSALNSADMRTEFSSIETDIADQLPALTGNGDKVVVVNSGGTALTVATSGIAVSAGGTGATTAGAARTSLGLVIGTDVQAYDAELAEIAALTDTDSNFIVGNGSAWVAESAGTVRTSLGLAIGTDVQAYDAELAEIAALADTDSNFMVGNGSAWIVESTTTARTSLGVGTGDSPMFTAVNVGHASDTTLTRVSGGLVAVEGNNVLTAATGQPLDTELSEIAALANTNNNFIVGTGTVWALETPANVRTSLGLVIGTNVQAYDAELTEIAALANTDSNFIVGTGTVWTAEGATTAATSMGVGTGNSPQFTAVNIGAATDTTVTRVSAGVIAVEGVTLLTASEGSFTVTWDDACTTSPADTWKYVKVGNMVTVMPQTDGINCTSDSAFFRTTGAEVPAAIRPAITKIAYFGFGTDAGVLARTCLTVDTGGNVSFGFVHAVGQSCSVSSWTNSGSKVGLLATFSYILT